MVQLCRWQVPACIVSLTISFIQRKEQGQRNWNFIEMRNPGLPTNANCNSISVHCGIKVKGKAVPVAKHPYMEGCRRSGHKALQILNFNIRWRWVVSPQYHMVEDWMGPGVGHDYVAQNKLSLPDIKPLASHLAKIKGWTSEPLWTQKWREKSCCPGFKPQPSSL
jgi:hypothetical protein